MEHITNAHDKLFRETWSDKENAREFLRHYLPPNILKLTDLNSLAIAKDSFIDKDLQDYFSDILYTLSFGNEPGYVYILFEHKSFSDRFIHLQTLEYMLKIWRLWLKQHTESSPKRHAPRYLPIIVPMVLYHGTRKWTTSDSFPDLFAGPKEALNEYIPDFTYVLYDVTDYADEEIKGAVIARVVLLLFKHIHDPDILERLPAILALLRDVLQQPNGLHCIEMILRYVFSAVEHATVEQLHTVADHALKGEFAMTVAEKLRREGEIKGQQEGYEQGLSEGIELALTIKFGEGTTQKIMPLIRVIHDLTRLKAIKDAIKTVQNFSEFQAMLGTSQRAT